MGRKKKVDIAVEQVEEVVVHPHVVEHFDVDPNDVRINHFVK